MEAYAKALLIAIPVFMVLVVIEFVAGLLLKNNTLKPLDTVSSLSSGLTNIIKSTLGLTLFIVSYPFLLKHLALFEIKASVTATIVGFIAIDFASYWNHRLNHRVNLFWNRHVIHHSSEEYNLPCALRQPISVFFSFYPLFLIPAALAGVPTKLIAVIAPVHLFMQFWYHTKHIGKMGILEYIIVTPSQHRVHHAINPEYIDKNFAAIFCVWDRMFGSFQEELEEYPPVYGVLKPARTWNPVRINFQHFYVLFRDAWNTRSWWDKVRIWFMPTGWRPEDVAQQYSYDYVEDVYALEKYDTQPSLAMQLWAFGQMSMSSLLLLYMFARFGQIGSPGVFLYGGLIFAGVYGYSAVMDRDKAGFWVELARSLVGFGIILKTGDWFGVNAFVPFGAVLIAAYFLATIAGSAYFAFLEKAPQTPEAEASSAG